MRELSTTGETPVPPNLLSKRLLLLLLVAFHPGIVRCEAGELFVDNRQGSDAFDASTPMPVGPQTGPAKSIRRALQVAQFGDTIVIKNTGHPYYESVQLVGPRHSGNENIPFTIVGNGAVISGLRTVPPNAWRNLGSDLWKMKPWRKGHYQLLLDGKPVPEHPVARGSKSLPKIPAGHWSAWRGSVYYQAAPLEEPARRPFQFAYEGVGLTLYKVRNVRISGVTFRHFRLDGVNAHDFCRNVVLDNVKSYENGRAGVSVGGTSEVLIRNSQLVRNRESQLRISELGIAEVDQTEMSAPPTIVD